MTDEQIETEAGNWVYRNTKAINNPSKEFLAMLEWAFKAGAKTVRDNTSSVSKKESDTYTMTNLGSQMSAIEQDRRPMGDH
jgi:hypothetical protein